MDIFWNAVWSLTPTVLVGLLFWLVLWSIIRADRHERAAQARIEAQELARMRAENPAAR
jgi:flagellar biosynthesis/type III secretory pathway M-ring protein FliF/YscJ